MPRHALLLASVAALLGVAGVVLAALSTHAEGGELGRTAAQFLILHAAALVGTSASQGFAILLGCPRLLVLDVLTWDTP